MKHHSDCPHCGAGLNMHNVTGPERHKPREGDATMCAYCGAYGFFRADGSLRPATPAEIAELEENPEMQRAKTLINGIVRIGLPSSAKGAKPCPRCEAPIKRFDASASGVIGPKPGDPCICLSCEAFLRYDDAMALRLATAEEEAEMMRDPQIHASIRSISEFRTWQKEHGSKPGAVDARGEPEPGPFDVPGITEIIADGEDLRIRRFKPADGPKLTGFTRKVLDGSRKILKLFDEIGPVIGINAVYSASATALAETAVRFGDEEAVAAALEEMAKYLRNGTIKRSMLERAPGAVS